VPAWYASRAQTLAQLRGTEPLAALQLEYSLVERSVENEYVPLGQQQGIGVMVWSPLGSGLLSGKYKPSQSRQFGEGRLQTVRDSNNPAFQRFTERNFQIVAELEAVAQEMERTMAQVAINWVARRPGVATVLVGATRKTQLEDNLAALDFELPAALRKRLDVASAPAAVSPYAFFTPPLQAMQTGENAVGDKPAGYYQPLLIDAKPAGVE
jgi:aryl-alcohol dehydrogenase-like predicted oxidoreductase